MAEPTDDPTSRELLERIARLESRQAEILSWLEDLSERVGRQRGRFECARSTMTEYFDDTFERIKALERTVFPNLLKDVHRGFEIIGDGVSSKLYLDPRWIVTPHDSD